MTLEQGKDAARAYETLPSVQYTKPAPTVLLEFGAVRLEQDLDPVKWRNCRFRLPGQHIWCPAFLRHLPHSLRHRPPDRCAGHSPSSACRATCPQADRTRQPYHAARPVRWRAASQVVATNFSERRLRLRGIPFGVYIT